MFEQLADVVRTQYPNMKIIGETHSPSPMKLWIARILFVIKLTLIAFLCLDQNIFEFLYLPTPNVYQWALKNKVYACLMIFWLPGFFESSLKATGAFEISIDNVKLWSKLETGRVPSSNELLQLLQTNINSK